jgi:hypothetical protein
MAITDGYCSLAMLKAALRIQDGIDDSLLELAISSASREIDGSAERKFTSTSGTRVYNPTDPFLLVTDDIVSITTLKTSLDGVTFDQQWATSDFQLEPLNGVSGGLTTPYTRIRAIGNYLWPTWAVGSTAANEASVQITGVFGWSSVPVAIQQACVILAMRIYKRLDAPLGIAGGFGDMGAMRVGRFDPDVEALVAPYRRLGVG